MSASSPISILDDDDDDEADVVVFPKVNDAIRSTTASRPHTQRQKEAIQMFLQIMGSADHRFAVESLEIVGYDVSRALSLVFESSSTRRADDAPTAAVPKDPKDETNHPLAPQKGSPEAFARKLASRIQLSDKWQRCYDHSQSTGEPFVDPDFPPTRSSLDGRRQKAILKTTAPGKPQDNVIQCICGLPATARTVQKDGPNYGRFYLSCGQPRSRRRHNSNNEDNDAAHHQKPQQCQFFQWDDKHGSRGANNTAALRYAHLAWHPFGPPTSVLYRTKISQDQVRQGSVGNCWFLSALAVVAEKEYLVRHLLPHDSLNDSACYQVNLCLDGRWTPVVVDSSLPVVYKENDGSFRKTHASKGAMAMPDQSNFVACPAFAAVPDGQLWPGLVEKAYAKAHGSYAQLSGGFIAEALSDMTGAPTETIVFGSGRSDADDELWARLLSFEKAGFLMGVATCAGGEGLVGNHAYSVLDVLEFHDTLVGAQQKVTDFFASNSPSKMKKAKTSVEEEALPDFPSSDARDRKTVRLVRIRNPWGTREWKGEWSASSDKWTTALRKRLGDQSFAKGDGTFFMEFETVMERFHHMDVAKCREGWHHFSVDGLYRRERMCSLSSSVRFYRIQVTSRTWATLSLIQPKKRAKTNSQYWYGDSSMLILRRKNPGDDWSIESSALHGCTRTCACEAFLDPAFEYCITPFSHHARVSAENASGAPFRVTAYSSAPVVVMEATRDQTLDERTCLGILHRVLLGVGHKLHYAVAPEGSLACIHGQECLYFLALNSSADHYLSLYLNVKETKGLLFMDGTRQDTFDIPPRSQAILMVVSHSGTDSSAAASVSFTYASSTVPAKMSSLHARSTGSGSTINSTIPISMAGDLIASGVSISTKCNRGGDTIETQLWLSQVGSGMS